MTASEVIEALSKLPGDTRIFGMKHAFTIRDRLVIPLGPNMDRSTVTVSEWDAFYKDWLEDMEEGKLNKAASPVPHGMEEG